MSGHVARMGKMTNA